MDTDKDPDEDRSGELETGFENENLSEGEEAQSDLEEQETAIHPDAPKES